MNGKGFQLNGRKAISLLLALLILALATAPALAWAPEDEDSNFSTSPQYQKMVQLNGGQDSSTSGTGMRLASPTHGNFPGRPWLDRIR
ncbi:MAG: hypothetical protein Kow0063_10750 [Anaerolineae bacterium]